MQKNRIYLTEKNFTPHLTLMKLSRMKNLSELGNVYFQLLITFSFFFY